MIPASNQYRHHKSNNKFLLPMVPQTAVDQWDLQPGEYYLYTEMEVWIDVK